MFGRASLVAVTSASFDTSNHQHQLKKKSDSRLELQEVGCRKSAGRTALNSCSAARNSLWAQGITRPACSCPTGSAEDGADEEESESGEKYVLAVHVARETVPLQHGNFGSSLVSLLFKVLKSVIPHKRTFKPTMLSPRS